MSETVEGSVVEVGTELDVVQRPAALFRTDDPVEVVQKATEVANALRDVLRVQKLTQNIQGKEHILVDGWTLVGAMLGVTAVCTDTEPVDGGFKATVEARTQDGRVIGRAEAVCTKHEKRGPWKSAEDYAKLSMAQTRATSKAFKGPLGFVVSLAGYATTPAEEMHGAVDVRPVQAPKVSQIEFLRQAVEAKKPGTMPHAKWAALLDGASAEQRKEAAGKLVEVAKGLGLDVEAVKKAWGEL